MLVSHTHPPRSLSFRYPALRSQRRSADWGWTIENEHVVFFSSTEAAPGPKSSAAAAAMAEKLGIVLSYE